MTTTPFKTARQAAEALLEKRQSIAAGIHDTDAFHRDALAFSLEWRLIETASNTLPTADEYMARLQTEGDALTEAGEALRNELAESAERLADAKTATEAPLSRLRASVGTLADELAAARDRLAAAKSARAAAIAHAIEAGTDATGGHSAREKAVQAAHVAAESAEAAHGAVVARIGHFEAVLRDAQDAHDAETRRIAGELAENAEEVCRFLADRAAGLYLIALAGIGDPDLIPDARLPVNQNHRVPFASGWQVDTASLRDHLRAAAAAPAAADWLARLERSGLLGFEFARTMVRTSISTTTTGGFW